jgi:hypothetical protein
MGMDQNANSHLDRECELEAKTRAVLERLFAAERAAAAADRCRKARRRARAERANASCSSAVE